MADTSDTFDETVIGKVKVTLDQDDFDADPIQALQSYLDRLSAAFGKAGKSSDFAFREIQAKLRSLQDEGKITSEQYQKLFSSQVDANPNLDKWQRMAFKVGAWLSPKKGESDFAKEWDETAKAVGRLTVSAYALAQPFRSFYRFTDQLRQANLQFSLLSQRAMTTAANLAGSGGAFAALGGSIASYANFRNSFEMEMEKRRIGLGNGGQFTQAMMHYGIQFDPNSFDRTMQNIIAFMSSSSKSESQKLMAGRMLGLDDATIAAAKRGNAFYNDYQRTIRSMSSHQDEAAKKSQELSLETYKLFTAFKDLKNAIFTDLEPVIQTIVECLTPIIEALNNPFIRGIGEIFASLLGLAFALKTLQMVFGTFKIVLGGGLKTILSVASSISRWFGGSGGGKIAEEVAKNVVQKTLGKSAANAAANAGVNALSTAAGNRISIPKPHTTWEGAVKDVNKLGRTQPRTPSPFRKIGGSMGQSMGSAAGSAAGGAIGIFAQAVDAVGGLVQRQIQIHSLSVLEKVVEKWHNEWAGYTLSRGGILGQNEEWTARNAKSLNIDKRFLEAGHLGMSLDLAEGRRLKMMAAMMETKSTSAGGVTVGKLELTVQTQATDPKAIADIVHDTLIDEFRVLDDGKGNDT